MHIFHPVWYTEMQQSQGRRSMLLMTKAAKFTLKVKSVENQIAIHKKTHMSK